MCSAIRRFCKAACGFSDLALTAAAAARRLQGVVGTRMPASLRNRIVVLLLGLTALAWPGCAAHPAAGGDAADSGSTASADASSTDAAGADAVPPDAAADATSADAPAVDAVTPADGTALTDTTAGTDAAAADAAAADTTDADAEVDAAVADAGPLVSTVTISVAPGLTLPQGHLHVRLVNYFVPTSQPTPYDDILFDGAADLPFSVTAVIPDGTWWPLAGWLSADAKPLASSISCDMSSVFVVTASQPAPQKVSIVISALGDPPSCGTATTPNFLGETSSYAIPFTDTGVTHLLEGLAWNGAWWMAANADGIGRVDLPAPGKQVSNWKSFGKGACRHIARLDKRLFCSQRDASIVWMDVDPATNLATANGELIVPGPVHVEGLLVRDTTLFAAAHGQGLVAVPLATPGTPLLLQAPALTDAWHVAALPNGNLVVANGAGGIVIVQATATSLTVLSQLKLPGLCAHLAVDGTTVAVGAIGGGLHLVDASQPDAPVLLGSLPAGPWPIVGVELKNGVAYAAAARGVLAVPVPTAPVKLLMASTMTPTEQFMTLDVRAVGDQLVTAEYALVRALALTGTPLTAPPIAMAEAQTWSPVMAVGQQAQYTAYVWNPGGAPLHLTNPQVTDVPAQTGAVGNGAPLPFVAPQSVTILPGQTAAIAVSVTKTAVGVQNAQVRLEADDPFRPFITVQLTESPALKLGQPLPPLAYQNAKGELVDVVAALQGKPALLIVSADSCPVAFERTAALLAEYGPAIASGKLAALLLNPWDLPSAVEIGAVPVPFTEVFSPLTTKDNTQYSAVADELLALPGFGPIPPLPHLFVLDAAGKVQYAHLGLAPLPLAQAIQKAVGP